MRATLADIAREAGVSDATVDRVMNERPGVSTRTRSQVLQTARLLGYLPPIAEEAPAPMRLRLLLPHGTNAYIGELCRQAQNQIQQWPHISLHIVRTRLDSLALAEALIASIGQADAVAVVAMNHPAIREAIRQLTDAQIPVITLASDIADAPRRAYIGIDNGQAGRLAGYTLGRFLGPVRSGKVALFAGTIGYRGHQEREMGFRQILAEDFPQLDLLELRESREDRNKAHAEARALLEAHSDLVGVYNAGGGTVGIAAALEDAERSKHCVFVAHEATEENKAYLLTGTLDAVIHQDAAAQIAQLLQTFGDGQGRPVEPHLTHHPKLILRENLPETLVNSSA